MIVIDSEAVVLSSIFSRPRCWARVLSASTLEASRILCRVAPSLPGLRHDLDPRNGRGDPTSQTLGIVTDVGLFLHRLAQKLRAQ